MSAKWEDPPFQTRDGLMVLPVKHRTRWAITSKGTRHLILRAVGVWDAGRVVYGARWHCGEWAGKVQFLPDDKTDVYTCRRCELVDKYGATTFAVYRYFSPTGELLYIGSTGDLGNRLAAHEQRSPWFSRDVRVEVEVFETEYQARGAESTAIWREQPLHNKRGRRAPANHVT